MRTPSLSVEGIRVPAGRVELAADLSLPEGATGLVLFAHGSGSSRHNPRNSRVAFRYRPAGAAPHGHYGLDWRAKELKQTRARLLRGQHGGCGGFGCGG